MKFKAFTVFLFVFLVSILTVSASDGCFVNQNCTYWAYTSGATVSEVNITIYDPLGNQVVTNDAMTSVDSETFKYIYSHNSTGNYLAYASFYNSSGLITKVAQSLQVRALEIGQGNQSTNMNGIAIILGVGVFCAILLYIAFSLEKEHVFWKIFTIIFVIMTLSLVVKGAVDSYENCNVVLVNTTTNSDGSLEYNYDEVCTGSTLSTGTSFLNSQRILVWAFGVYLLIFFLWKATEGFKDTGRILQNIMRKRK